MHNGTYGRGRTAVLTSIPNDGCGALWRWEAISFSAVRAGYQEGVLMRRFMILLILLLLVVGCSSGSDSGDIAFEHSLDMPSGTSVWSATGEAIDSDLFCSAATGVLEGFEDEDGAARMPEDIEALFEAGEPFVNVSVESMSCETAYADFELRFINEIDPSITDGEPVTKVTWAITGDVGYDTTSGQGDNEIPYVDGDSFIYNGTGTITKD
jgi:hypothetical protein